jgi:hypothetical protein
LSRPDTGLRTLAVQALAAAHGRDPAVQLRLVRVLRQDGSMVVRVCAAEALASWALGNPKTHAYLRAACGTVFQPHRGQPAVVAGVLALLAHLDPLVRESAAPLLARPTCSPDVRAALIAALGDANIPAARAALQALTPFLADGPVLAAVVALLGHPCLYYAAVPLLLPGRTKRPSSRCSCHCWKGAGRSLAPARPRYWPPPAIGPGPPGPYLPPHPEDHPQGRISAAIIRGLRHQVACPAVQAVLLPRLADNHWWIVAAVLDTLAPVAADPAIQPAVVARLTDANDQIRHAACGALRPLYPLPLFPRAHLAGEPQLATRHLSSRRRAAQGFAPAFSPTLPSRQRPAAAGVAAEPQVRRDSGLPPPMLCRR